jgi:1,4-alpha-glucan branching enzyme
MRPSVRTTSLIDALIRRDPFLEPWRGVLCRRLEKVESLQRQFERRFGSLLEAANTHGYLGLHPHPDGWVFREWAPNAVDIFLLCPATRWKPKPEMKLKRGPEGVFSGIFARHLLRHGDRYKLLITWKGGAGTRIPSHATRVVQTEGSENFDAQVWSPANPHRFVHPRPEKPAQPLIYEAHVGMASELGHFASYDEFRRDVLPRIQRAGYNTLQLMALAEHPYYASFGYHVTSFFAPSSRFGTPEALKELIDAAHGCGLAVLMDLVHSHASRNKVEGLSHFDGTEFLYFHQGTRGHHPAWDTRCFDYGKMEVLAFLLSNCRYWLEEFNLDGFRFDGVTSMLYHHRGLGRTFSSYADYFGMEVDEDALSYLTLANRLIRQLRPQALTVAEDVSGMPGLGLAQERGGVGFDYRLAMGLPDYWIRLIKERRDEEWHMADLFFQLTNHRAEERVIAYAESHDQALVGDQTLIFRMLGHLMYTHMSLFHPHPGVQRGVALHKLIRLVTLAAGGSGYLNFMGNEFGHPEWIDFPREGNGWSHLFARRQWSLAEDGNLWYCKLRLFDQAMLELAKQHRLLTFPRVSLLLERSEEQILAFLRGPLLFLFNFSPTRAQAPLSLEVPPGQYELVLNTDWRRFGGQDDFDPPQALDPCCLETAVLLSWQLRCPLPARSALVFQRRFG